MRWAERPVSRLAWSAQEQADEPSLEALAEALVAGMDRAEFYLLIDAVGLTDFAAKMCLKRAVKEVRKAYWVEQAKSRQQVRKVVESEP